MKQYYLDKFIVFLIVLLIIFAIFLQISTFDSTNKLKKERILQAQQYAERIVKLIQYKTNHNNMEEVLKNNLKLRKDLDEVLYAFLTKEYKYIFMLKKDKKGKYRFLLDASMEEPEEFMSLFFPQSGLFETVYETGVMQIVKQGDGVKEIWLSLLYPILKEGKTEALLVLDLSKSYGEYLENFHSPLMEVVHWMQIFLVLSIVSLLYFAYSYHKVRLELIQDKLTLVYKKYYLEEFFNKNTLNQYHVILIDIDEFKNINQKYGNPFGDIAIQMFADTMVKFLSSSCRVIRSGGTEFLVIAPKSEYDIEKLASDLFQTLQDRKYFIDNDVIRLNVSMSAMSTPENSVSILNILRILDEELLKIKSRGKNALSVVGVKHLDSLMYSNIDYIKEALDHERLLCLYQPIYHTKTKEIAKYEVLVRLIDKDDPKKLIAPMNFMDVIRGTSQYIKLSKLVFKHLFTTLQTYPKIELTVNVDLDDLANKDMMNLITTNLDQHRDIASRLTFEILEGSEIKDHEEIANIFKQLKIFGSKVALDDFGSGYSNYTHLIELDIDILKIDGDLIRQLDNFPQRAKIVLKSIQELSHTLQCEVVAEFVYNEAIYNTVNALDIEFSQGYYLGKPRPINEYLT